MNESLLIIGAGSYGKIVKETVIISGTYNKIDYLDDNSRLAIGVWEDFDKFVGQYNHAFVALGDPTLRSIWMDKISGFFHIPTIIHPTAYVSPSAKLDIGCYVGVMAVVSVESYVSQGSIVDIGAIIEHECEVGEYSHINAGAIVKARSNVPNFASVSEGKIYSMHHSVGENERKEYFFEAGM